MKKKPTPALKTPDRPIDPHLVALLVFMLGEDTSRESAGETITHMVNGASEILDSDPLATTFDEHSGRANAYEIVSRNVERALEASDPLAGDEKRQALAVLRAVNRDGGALRIDDPETGYYLLIEYAEMGLLLGAALMYGLLKDGVK